MAQAVYSSLLARLILLVAVAAAVASAAACGQADDPAPTSTSMPTAETSTPVGEAGSQGVNSDGTPNATSSSGSDSTDRDTGVIEPPVTPPALLSGTAEATAPALSGASPVPADTPTPPEPTIAPPLPPVGSRVGQSAPDFEVTTIDGATRSLTDYKQANQPVVLYFFAVW